MSKRIYWQSVRGICILSVVLIHSLGGDKYVDDTGFIIFRKLINFAVATFIFMSGYFVDADAMKSENFNCKSWLTLRGGRLLIPFTAWSFFYSGISIAQRILNGEVINWIGVICRLFVGKAAVPLYYIVVLFQLTILTPLLLKTIAKKGVAEKLLWLVTPAYLVYVYAWNFTTGNMPFLYETFFPAWFVFYYLGMQVKCGMKLKGNIMLLTAMFLFSCGEALLLRQCGMSQGFYTSQITVGSFLYAVAFIAAIMRVKNAKENILSRIGDCSYGIFYTHMFILILIGKVMSVGDNWILYWGIRFVLTSLLSYSIVRIGQKLLDKEILTRFGFI